MGNRTGVDPFLGKTPTRNAEIAAAAAALQKQPHLRSRLDKLTAEICSALERGPSRRRRIGSLGLSKQTAALVRTYAPRLRADLAAKVRERCSERFAEILGRLEARISRSVITINQAAIALGIGVADLTRMLRDPSVRRALGWPRPVGGHVLFGAAAFDPVLAETFLSAQPKKEPWPTHSWPEGWR